MRTSLLSVSVVLLTVSSVAIAIPIDVGTGTNSASVQIEFKDGAAYDFSVSFDGSVTGLGLFDIIEAETTLTTVRGDFGWGIFIDGISYDGHSNVGFDGGEDWWHYWVMEAGDPDWTSPLYGVVDRTAINGSSDGWVYGRAGAPAPEPTTAALLAAAGLMLIRNRRLY